MIFISRMLKAKMLIATLGKPVQLICLLKVHSGKDCLGEPKSRESIFLYFIINFLIINNSLIFTYSSSNPDSSFFPFASSCRTSPAVGPKRMSLTAIAEHKDNNVNEIANAEDETVEEKKHKVSFSSVTELPK